MKGKEYLSQYCQDHSGEEIYEFLKNLSNRSLGYTDSRLSIVDWLDKDIDKGEEE